MSRRSPTATDVDITWQVIEEMAVRGAAILAPDLRPRARPDGSPLDPDRPDPPSGQRPDARAGPSASRPSPPNMQVKFPATAAGLVAIEEATALGISINATVSFTVPQALAVGAAVERGLERRAAAGGDVATMSPVCTLMIGRLDDWMKASASATTSPSTRPPSNWAGIAVFKQAAALYRERGYRTRLLAAAYRHQLHWTELDRRRRQPDDAVGLAASVQRLGDRGRATLRRSGAGRLARELLEPDPGLRPGLRARRPDDRRVRHLRRDGADAARRSSARTGIWSGRSTTSCCRTPTPVAEADYRAVPAAALRHRPRAMCRGGPR